MKERTRLESGVGSIEAHDEVSRLTLETELNLRAGEAIKDAESLLHRIGSYERSLETSSPDAKERVDAMSNMLTEYHALRKFSLNTLPLLEHQTILRAIQEKSASLEKRILLLASIVHEQNEDAAAEAAKGFHHSGLTKEDTQTIANWMLGRYMLSELAPENNLVIRWLLNWKWVLTWILVPFVASAVLYWAAPRLGHSWLPALPFLLIPFAQVLLLLIYCRSPAKLPGGISNASLLLPQLVGALFLGIHDFFWWPEKLAIGVLEEPLVRVVNIAIFLAASYFFVRSVFLKGQYPKRSLSEKAHKRVLNQRTLAILSIGLWQAFGLTTFFILLKGALLAGPHLGNFAQIQHAATGGLQALQEHTIPSVLTVGTEEWQRVQVFPWAILSMAVEMFFVSAIFERIMHRGTK